jgi:hypothetical protein
MLGRCKSALLMHPVSIAAIIAGRYFAVMVLRHVLPDGFFEPCIPTLAAGGASRYSAETVAPPKAMPGNDSGSGGGSESQGR